MRAALLLAAAAADFVFVDFNETQGLRLNGAAATSACEPCISSSSVAIAPAVRARLASYHAGTVARLNALLGNGNIRWWDEETLASVAATQEEAFLETRPGPYGTAVRGPDARDDDRSAATGMTPFSSLVRH